MSLQPPVANIPQDVLIAGSALSDEALAYVVDMIKLTRAGKVPGWTYDTYTRLDRAFESAAKLRGIQDGAKAVTQTVELRS